MQIILSLGVFYDRVMDMKLFHRMGKGTAKKSVVLPEFEGQRSGESMLADSRDSETLPNNLTTDASLIPLDTETLYELMPRPLGTKPQWKAAAEADHESQISDAVNLVRSG